MHSVHGAVMSVDNAIHDTFNDGHHHHMHSQEHDQESIFDGGDPVSRTVDRTVDRATRTADKATRFNVNTGTSATSMNSGASASNDIKTQHRRHSIGYKVNKSAMDATRRDIDCLRDADSLRFEPVGAKIEDTIGSTALTDDSIEFSRFHG
ncbi:hypothetical protein BJV82DRAFT_62029 [Fennellomyces sp. T-0311]|nr:hypothetical protein BJV82DRAFT_62029 [Fennellomyces sp. T-0311]